MTGEDRKYIVDWLDAQNNGRPYILLKFCEKETFARDVCNGNLYANTPEWFRKKELESGERGQGDVNELILPIRTNRVILRNPKTKAVLWELDNATASFRIDDDDKKAMVSFIGIPIRDMILCNATMEEAHFRFPFTKEEFEQISEKFGSYCAVVAEAILHRKADKFSIEHKVGYVLDAVQYCEENRLDRIEAFGSIKKERFLYKDKDLDYQREYRLAFGMDVPQDHFVRLGRLDGAGYMKSEKLKDMEFVIRYETKQTEQN